MAAPEIIPALHDTLMFVDDDAQLLAMHKLFFESYGYRVLTTPSPTQALEILKRSPVGLLVVDYSMPEMTGDVLAQEARRGRPGLPIIMVTGEVPRLGSQARAQISELLPKGQPTSLLSAVERLMPRFESPVMEEAQVWGRREWPWRAQLGICAAVMAEFVLIAMTIAATVVLVQTQPAMGLIIPMAGTTAAALFSKKMAPAMLAE